MKQLFTILIMTVFALLCGSAHADMPLDRVLVAGIDSLLAGELSAELLSRPGGILNDGYIARDTTLILERMRAKGWWGAKVTANPDSSENNITLRFEISPGQAVITGRISTVIDGGESTVTAPTQDMREGSAFTQDILETAMSSVLGKFLDEGYPEVSVVPRLRARSDSIDVDLYVTPGRQALIDSIAVLGLSRTKPATVARELSSLIGRKAATNNTETARSLLAQLSHVRIASDPLIVFGERGEGILQLNMEEGSQGSFDGVLGYQPSSTDDNKGEIVGTADITLNNLFGTGRAAAFRWEKLGGDSEDLELAYTEPWIFGRPYHVSGTFMQEEREAQGYIQTSLSGGVERRFGTFGISLGWRYEKVSADTLYSSSAQGIESAVSWRTSDDQLNPTRGADYSAGWSMLAKRFTLGETDNSRLERLEMDLTQYVPVRKRQVLAIMLRYRRIDTGIDALSPSDRYWLGGSRTIRGHAEKMYPAVKAYMGSLEYRFLTGERSRAFIFYDIGHLENLSLLDDVETKNKRTIWGCGFGLRIASRAGVVGFDYGLPDEGGFAESKLHVSMRREF